MSFSFLKTNPQWIPGIGPLFARRLRDAGFKNYFDILSCLPTRYTPYTPGMLPESGPIYIQVRIGAMQGRNPWKISCVTVCGQPLNLVFFHRPKPFWTQGSTLWIKGTITASAYGTRQVVHPEPAPVPQSNLCIVTEYTLPKGVSNGRFSGWVAYILDHFPDKFWSPIAWRCAALTPTQTGADPLKTSPSDIDAADTMPWHTCFMQAHFPQCPTQTQEMASWRQSLATSTWVAQHISMAKSHAYDTALLPINQSFTKNSTLEHTFLHHFGHPLTPSQEQAWSTISKALESGIPMRRLIHGDVGSGKTLVAFLAMLQVVACGKQACLMAPTETLIRQHFAHLTEWSKDISVQLILGKGQRLGPEDAPLILGTHALLYDGVSFDRLALVVIDEQQRFGVQQRLKIMEKGSNPHVLFLSATPIPRTFQRLIAGQMDVSILEKRPSAVPLTSYVVGMDKLQDLHPWIEKCIARQECIYWVCPAIDDEDLGVHTRYAYWKAYFPGKVAVLHGRMSAQEKDAVMTQFRSGITPLLVTTTVIEVGIHVSQASTIFIEESPRFGLSQLHQLRGRVGRDHIPGHCFFLYTPELSWGARQRLQFMRICQDGFEIAEKDWLWRGSGTVLGTQQSGHEVLRFVPKEYPKHVALSCVPHAEYLLKYAPDLCASLLDLFGYQDPDILDAG